MKNRNEDRPLFIKMQAFAKLFYHFFSIFPICLLTFILYNSMIDNYLHIMDSRVNLCICLV